MRGYPEELEAEQIEEEEEGPEACDAGLRGPEDCGARVRGFCFEVVVLEEVGLVAVLVRGGPPAQADQHAARDVLDGPEVEHGQNRDQQEREHAVVAGEEVDGHLEELEDAVEGHGGAACVPVFGRARNRVFRAVRRGL